MTYILLFALLGLVCGCAAQEPNRYLDAFPPAGEGMERYIIQLPHKERGEEDAFRVELIVGKKMQTDGVNRLRLGGEIADQPLKGWGFTYYEVKKIGPAASTLMAVPPGTPKVEAFVALPTRLIRYNSRVPLVVYVPQDAEVRYRIWQADETTQEAEKN